MTIETTDPAPTPPEVLRERGRLDFEADLQKVLMQRVASEFAGRLADAALAVFRGQQDPAVQRVLALCEIADKAVRSTGMVQTDAIRAAIAGDGR